MNDQKKSIHLVGAGFSGLSLAYLLAKTNLFQITIFEKKPTVGGMIHSSDDHGHVIESAANSILCTDQTLNFFNEINADIIRPLSTAKKRYFFREKLSSWPLTIFETLCFIPRLLIFLLKRKNFFDTVWIWSQKTLGLPFTRYVVSPGLQGIYATSADHLDAKIVLSPMFQKKTGKYQGIVSGRRGMQDIITALEKKCREMGVEFQMNSEYQIQSSAEAKVICTSGADACHLLGLPNIEMNNVLSVTCTTNVTSRPKGFGCLVPKDQGLDCLGVLFNTDIFENRNSETYIFSGVDADRVQNLNEINLKQHLFQIRKRLFNVDEQILEVRKFYWPQGLPVYNQNLAEFQSRIKLPKGTYLHGNYISGIGLSKIMMNSFELSEKIIKDLK